MKKILRHIYIFTTLFLLAISCKKDNTKQESIKPNAIKKELIKQELTEPHKTLLTRKGYGGSITILDYNNNKLFYTDINDTYNSKYLPASSFKVINSCIALDQGIVSSIYDNTSIPWDGIIRPVTAPIKPELLRQVNQDRNHYDTNISEAYQHSIVWFYQDIAKKMYDKNPNAYRRILQDCDYGNWADASLVNQDYQTNINAYKDDKNPYYDFWNYGDFGVLPIQQINFLKALYEEKLPFKKSTHNAVKEIMLLADPQPGDKKYTIRSKSGWTNFGDKETGWYIGYTEYNGNVYFFATVLTQPKGSKNYDFIPDRRNITQKILADISALPPTTATQ